MNNYPVNYEIVDEAGTVVSHGSCWSSEVDQVEVGPGLSLRTKLPGAPVAEDEIVYNHASVRAQEYPAIQAQLGVIWKVLAALPAKYLNDEATAMMQRIADVKAQYEKGANYVLNDGTDPKVRGRFMKVKE